MWYCYSFLVQSQQSKCSLNREIWVLCVLYFWTVCSLCNWKITSFNFLCSLLYLSRIPINCMLYLWIYIKYIVCVASISQYIFLKKFKMNKKTFTFICILLILRSPYFPILDVSFHLVHTLNNNVSYRKVIQVKQKKKKEKIPFVFLWKCLYVGLKSILNWLSFLK